MDAMSRMEMIRNKIDSLPVGSVSESNHYWCVTCKKFFVLDKPECPFMTGMCVNTPIAVENLAPESTESLEKFGLFYPKIPQRILSGISSDKLPDTGRLLSDIYLDFLKEWKFNNYEKQPLQTIKSFIIILSGCETAQRVNDDSVTFVLMDAGKIWKKEKIREILKGGLENLKDKLGFTHNIDLDFIDILGERETGKYYCAKCGMFFEFGMKRDHVTCPLMAQKCMFDPQHIEKVTYPSEKLAKLYEVTPDIFRRFISAVSLEKSPEEITRRLLEEWKITDNVERITAALT